jgi:hypothetical protein
MPYNKNLKVQVLRAVSLALEFYKALSIPESAKNREDASYVLKRNCVSCVLFELRVIDLVARKDNHLRLTTLLDYPTRVCSMVLQKLVQ